MYSIIFLTVLINRITELYLKRIDLAKYVARIGREKVFNQMHGL